MRTINVRTEYVIEDTDLPKELHDSFRDCFAKWEMKNGDRLQFDAFSEYIEENGLYDELRILQDFMYENELEDTYYIHYWW